nr:NADH dehydrogenase [ubiquinone] 1 alpha subcomplex subunit 2-like [Hydra vulgaris]
MASRHIVNLSRNIRELRLHLCQTSESSLGARNFIEKYYVDIKRNNPELPILIRECSGIQPKITARYAFGVEKTVSLADHPAEYVVATIENLAKNV